jgi:glycogen operon protein
LSGSSDLYEQSGRRPYASINFINCHDGFTLQDLVSYNDKHNEANGENNQDGANDNNSWNCGVEGPTDDPAILALRAQQKRNLIATLMLSQGVPMIRGGDELSQSQGGNNNAYCQDNELNWLNWELDLEQQEFLEFVRRMTELWRTQPVFQRRRFFHGRGIRGSAIKDISWIDSTGQEMSDDAWSAGFIRSLGIRLAGDLIGDLDERGQPVTGDSFLLLLNAHHEPITFQLPATKVEHRWERVVDTTNPSAAASMVSSNEPYQLAARSLSVFRTSTIAASEPVSSAIRADSAPVEQRQSMAAHDAAVVAAT